MKKIIISSFLLIGVFSYSQTLTKKYNSMTRQYEYFNSRGSMIGYEKYNSMTRQWEYYEIEQRQAYQYRDPAQVDLSPLGNATSILQNRYNNNTSYLQQQVTLMEKHVYSLDITDSQKNQIMKTFNDVPLKSVNSQSINYSSLSKTNEVINYLRDSLNKIIKNVTDVKNKSSVSNLEINYSDPIHSAVRNVNTPNPELQNKIIEIVSNNYNNKIGVYKIVRYKGSISTELKIKTDSYIILNNYSIQFKRADGSIDKWDFNSVRADLGRKGVIYYSKSGSVFVHQDERYIQFYDFIHPTGDNYKYFLN